MIYFTSDLHFGHNKDFLYEPRGFNSIEEHDKTIIENWNKIITPNDEVYILGDLMLNNNEHGIECLNKLNGHIHVILGNHDSGTRALIYEWDCPNIDEIVFATMLKIGKTYFYLSHYPTCVGNFDDYKKMWCLCGHSHTKDKFIDMDKKCYHVELDAHDNCPIDINTIIQDIQQYRKENNNNEI